MKRLLITLAALAAFAGCQTRITATKNAENIHPTYSVATVNGTNALIVTGYKVTSGGWEATARSPLWAAESIKGLEISVATNGTVSMAINDYQRDLSTNAVAVTQILTDGAINLAAKVAAACATGGATNSTSVIASWVKAFVEAGGDADSATVSCTDGSCTITDGTTTCTDGSCSRK